MFEARFQTFDDPPNARQRRPRVAALRAELERRGLDGFIVPRADRHQNEYVPPSEERLAWLTGFTGSAGAAIVLADRAALFVDGRYTLQARDQVDTALFAIVHLVENAARQVARGEPRRPATTLGYDPWLHTADGAEKLAQGLRRLPARRSCRPSPTRSTRSGPTALPRRSARVVAARPAIRRREPPQTSSRASAPRSRSCKADALVVSDPHDVAWTFNIRGADVAHTPLPLAFAIVPREGRPALYIDGRKLTNEVRD